MPDPRRSKFGETRWSMVLSARDGAAGQADAHAALSELCRLYWHPLYSFVRRSGHSPAEAEDLTQEFFARLLERKWLASVDRSKGRFRAFLLAAMKHFLANEWRRNHALKRGGGNSPAAFIPLDAEERYAAEPSDPATPENLFHRRWALTLLDHVFATLRNEMAEAGKASFFDAMKDLLSPDPKNLSYRDAGARLGLSEDAVKMAVYRLRKRYRDLLRAHIAATVETDAAVDAEIRELFRALAGS